MHPALHKGWKLNRDAIARFGTMCPANGRGKPSTTTLQVWVDLTWWQSVRITVSGFVAGCLLGTGTPSLTNTDAAPVSAIPCASSMLIILVRGAKPTCWEQDKMLDVITVVLFDVITGKE